ncbi:CPBP family intramembrane metalloprotease [Leucobacter weissii]|uniref:CPBP family intramembrane metalloprotease n=1 Tax=Leucobacter weissii TaxID=1983706 RepID=A0A939ML40_9MICO|nr:type II CAAX endopeptidase family protein [Leucobacter weissii]MBO1902753.1 CPBP family intramembrane metalloprotease [Leucobacter weissii]
MTFEPPQDPQQSPRAPQPQAPPPVDASQYAAPSQPQWAWAAPAPQPQWEETGPLEFHQALRGVARYRWWRPLLGLVLGVVYYFTLSLAFTIPFMPYLFSSGAVSLTSTDIDSSAIIDTQEPILLLLGLGSVALMIPSVILAMLSIGLRPTGRVWSVALRIRWRWIWRTLLPAIVTLIVMNAVGIALEFAFGSDTAEAISGDTPEIDTRAALWSLLIVLLLVPLQATGEEVVFRGAFMQAIGGWLGAVRGSSAFAVFLRGPWLPILIPSVAFGFSHIYDIWGWLAVVAMAVAMGWLTWRTGGLEAAITLHVMNNLVAFAYLASGISGETAQTESSGGLGSLIGTASGLVLYSWWVNRDFTRRDGRRTRTDLVEVR